jgi:hypothetical protein
MDLARSVAIQFNIVNYIYLLVGLIIIGAIAIVGCMYLYVEYQEYKRKQQVRTDRPWL